MKKEELEIYIKEGKSIREISKETKKSFSTIRHWLKKFEIKTLYDKYNKGGDPLRDKSKKYCPKCNEYKNLEDFYLRKEKDRSGENGYCRDCLNKYQVERWVKVKLRMIEYKGGKCKKCGLEIKDSHYSVFEFHHIDPKAKDNNFENIRTKKFDTIKKELDKCVMLCSNCHRITHAEINGTMFL